MCKIPYQYVAKLLDNMDSLFSNKNLNFLKSKKVYEHTPLKIVNIKLWHLTFLS